MKPGDTEDFTVAVVGYSASENFENEEAAATQQDDEETWPF